MNWLRSHSGDWWRTLLAASLWFVEVWPWGSESSASPLALFLLSAFWVEQISFGTSSYYAVSTLASAADGLNPPKS